MTETNFDYGDWVRSLSDDQLAAALGASVDRDRLSAHLGDPEKMREMRAINTEFDRRMKAVNHNAALVELKNFTARTFESSPLGNFQEMMTKSRHLGLSLTTTELQSLYEACWMDCQTAKAKEK